MAFSSLNNRQQKGHIMCASVWPGIADEGAILLKEQLLGLSSVTAHLVSDCKKEFISMFSISVASND